MINLYLYLLKSHAKPEQLDMIEDALRPNTINPATGLPYGWDEDEEDALIDALPSAPTTTGRSSTG